ncbi:MAG: hypothetical protein HGA76_09085 [Candidatus Firestonebacteria bacterium]|nr:hypothetical protein [Candidatus Firestonebacteria bacterium]
MMRLSGRVWGKGLFMLLALPGLAGCVPHHVPQPKVAEYNGSKLTYDAFFFQACDVKTFPRLTQQENGTDVPVEVFPARFSFNLKDKRPMPALAKGPRYFFPVFSEVTVIPLQDPSVKDFELAYPGLAQAARSLSVLLQKRPTLASVRRDIPDIGEVDCTRSIIAKPQFLEFASGSGVVFLTQYGQEFRAINNEELALVFEGLSSDGSMFVAARLAVGHPTLDRGPDAAHPLPASKQAKYLKHIEQELDFFPESSFNPPLQDLKALLASLTLAGVSRTAQEAAHPSEVSHGSNSKK